MKKFLFYLVWIIILSVGPITVIKNTPLELLSTNRIILVNFIQRILALTAFTMLFTQIVLGSFMHKWIEKLGAWVLRFHMWEGLTAYVLVILHPLMFFLFNYFIYRSRDIFYIFVDVCILCKPPIEYFYSLGRLSFWLLSLAIAAALLRTATPFLRLHWRKFHALNYLTFLLVWIHSLGVGSDIGARPFSFFHAPALIVVTAILVFKLYGLVRQKMR